MREIKFRAWNKRLSIMVGNAVVVGQYGVHAPTMQEADVTVRGDEYEIMQFIGLKDKNGVEIYEGDIIFYNSTGYKGEVAYSHLGVCGFYTFDGGVDADFGGRKPLEHTADIEVIGNIYENKELLK